MATGSSVPPWFACYKVHPEQTPKDADARGRGTSAPYHSTSGVSTMQILRLLHIFKLSGAHLDYINATQ